MVNKKFRAKGGCRAGAFGRCRLIHGGFNSCIGLSVEKFACVSWMVSRLRQEVVTPGPW